MIHYQGRIYKEGDRVTIRKDIAEYGGTYNNFKPFGLNLDMIGQGGKTFTITEVIYNETHDIEIYLKGDGYSWHPTYFENTEEKINSPILKL